MTLPDPFGGTTTGYTAVPGVDTGADKD